MAKSEITLVTLDHAQSFLNFVADTICKRACSSEALELPSRDSFVRVTRSTADAEDAFGKPIADVARLYTLVDVVVVQCAKDSSSTPYSIRADALNQIIA